MSDGRRRVTLRDIADIVGLSVNTVSRALAGKGGVGEATRARIRAEAERMGYVPNSIARSLVLGAATTLGLVLTNPSNPLYAQLISAIEQRGRVHGYSLLLVATEESLDNERTAVRELMRWGVDGAIVVPVQHEFEHWRQPAKAGVPIVLLNRDIPELGLDFVGIDSADGVCRSTRHVIERGARRIVLLEEDLAVSSIASRIEGFTRALAEYGADGEVVRVPSARKNSSALPWEPMESYRLAGRLLADTPKPSAIMVGNDYFALGVYRALAEAGLRTPDDIAVVGFGDHPFAAYLSPPLTTMRLPAGEIGVAAVDLLLRRLRDRERNPARERLLFPPQLVVRESSAAK